ncbi:hypothetical protein GCM10027093_26950 [Paraburkholderia jirisanensis]
MTADVDSSKQAYVAHIKKNTNALIENRMDLRETMPAINANDLLAEHPTRTFLSPLPMSCVAHPANGVERTPLMAGKFDSDDKRPFTRSAARILAAEIAHSKSNEQRNFRDASSFAYAVARRI